MGYQTMLLRKYFAEFKNQAQISISGAAR